MASKFDVERLKGIVVPIITPVTDAYDGKIDIARLCDQVDYVIEHGVDGILAFGSNSEFYMFDDDEMIEATRAIVERAAGRVPVFFGVGHIRTSKAVALAKRAAELNVDAVSVLTPMFIHPTEEANYHHFKAVADAIPDTMVLIYSNPGRAGYAMTRNTISRIAHDCENIVGIKDSSGDITNLQELIRLTDDIDFAVFAGKDTVVFPALCCGAVGAVCSTSNMYPELVCGIYDKFVEGDYKGSLEYQTKLNPIRLSQDAASFPAATKDMANLMGMNAGPSVLPTEPADGAALEGMKAAMRAGGYLD
ncbi:dihydrodipicolinate synthase family protein [Collinsella tanakaei]|uniref:Dihydrodipicolinate synthase family protein n=1 Tax=Collinsella ihumii TaxID=1720204 RepID=A0AAW7JUV3_9ACTN|nr:dihydrodipicolinate synthase family protein [Collinsella ihumii]MBM6688884.1 dihydrodipicolinate synthase family protein [Collinsella tanakaei]MBM6776559.1 dihydrodipicolinate synthase family protein [Collinsella tanakaei]MBM6785544.1 dihydrodipicolinate synthase family protein [Collinsella tanakaei]MCF6412889.1 dihydrodipicolinate synthase family protein [Collinsella tanakaei]MDN0054946.1 dihydrodipicolinate synthase family protein [Collinsella ihumii]